VKRDVYVFDYDNDSGMISNQRVFIHFEGDMAVPDGMTIDNDNCIWVAQWGGYGVSRFDPDGTFMEKINVPARNITACTFGGPDLNELYITSAKNGDDSTEHDGLLYRATVNATGQPAYHFKVN
jgi:sugar lactone lactonase YvrE